MGNAAAFFRSQMAQSTHIVQTVSKLDDNNPYITGHCQQHFSQIFSLGVLSGFKCRLSQLGHTFYQLGNGFTKFGNHVTFGHFRVFDNVVQQTGHDAFIIHMHHRQYMSYR